MPYTIDIENCNNGYCLMIVTHISYKHQNMKVHNMCVCCVKNTVFDSTDYNMKTDFQNRHHSPHNIPSNLPLNMTLYY